MNGGPEYARGGRALHDSAEQAREDALFPELNPGPVCRLDLNATVIRANPAAIAIFGEALIGRCWRDVLPELTDSAWTDIVERGERVWLETVVGATHLAFTMARAPGSRQVFVYGADVSALKKAERRLAELARFPEMNPGPVLRIEKDGTIVLANAAARALFGGTQLLEGRWPEICPGMTAQLWSRILAAHAPIEHETPLADRQILFTHVNDALSDQIFVYGVDLTAQKSAERALRQSERMATLGTLAAGVAHELNNPAAAVQRAAEHLRTTFGQLQEAQRALSRMPPTPALIERLDELDRSIRDRALTPPEFDPVTRSDREYDVELWLDDHEIAEAWDLAPALVSLGYGPAQLDELADGIPPEYVAPVIQWIGRSLPVHSVLEEVRHGASRIAEIVTALKAYSYVGQAPVQSVDVNEGIRHTLVILQNKLKRGVTVTLELDPDLPRVQAYGGELNQVWTNLIDNAADAMNGAGRLRIRTAPGDDWVRVEVEDDGPGIPEPIQGRVFDPFFTTKDPGRGTGLGLHTTYNTVVKKHRGTIELQSQPGRTCFVIRLRQVLDAEPTAPAAEAGADP